MLTRFLVIFVLILLVCLIGIWLDHGNRAVTLRIARQHFQLRTLQQQHQELNAQWHKAQSLLLLQTHDPTAATSPTETNTR